MPILAELALSFLSLTRRRRAIVVQISQKIRLGRNDRARISFGRYTNGYNNSYAYK